MESNLIQNIINYQKIMTSIYNRPAGASTQFTCKLRVWRRSLHSKVFCEKGTLKIFAKFTEKHLCASFFFNEETLEQVSLYVRETLQICLDVSVVSLHDVSTKSQMKLPTPSPCVSLVYHQDVSVVHIHDVPLVGLQCVSSKSQMKHLATSLWYVSTTPRSYVVATPC